MSNTEATHSNDTLISFEGVYLKVGVEELVQNITFTIKSNEIITLLGPNGAGKTTLSRLVAGLEKPTQGKIIRKSGLTIGYVPQQISLKKNLPVSVERFLKSGRVCSDATQEKALRLTNIRHLLPKSIHVLSGGERQRVLLARALFGDPQLLVLDEPMQGIDLQGQEELYALLYEIQRTQNISIFLVSHDLHIVMSESNKIMCLNKHLCCSGSSEEIKQNPAFLRLFGLESSDHLAVYQHKHDHKHSFIRN